MDFIAVNSMLSARSHNHGGIPGLQNSDFRDWENRSVIAIPIYSHSCVSTLKTWRRSSVDFEIIGLTGVVKNNTYDK